MPGFMINNAGGDQPNTVETLRAYRWRIIELGPILARDILLFAKELTLPQYKIEVQDITPTTLKYKYAKSINWEDVSITFYDYEGLAPELSEWKDLVHTVSEGIKTHTNYKKVCRFHELNGLGNAIREIVLFGAWPSSINYGKLSYTNSDIKTIDMTITYDYAEIGAA